MQPRRPSLHASRLSVRPCRRARVFSLERGCAPSESPGQAPMRAHGPAPLSVRTKWNAGQWSSPWHVDAHASSPWREGAPLARSLARCSRGDQASMQAHGPVPLSAQTKGNACQWNAPGAWMPTRLLRGARVRPWRYPWRDAAEASRHAPMHTPGPVPLSQRTMGNAGQRSSPARACPRVFSLARGCVPGETPGAMQPRRPGPDARARASAFE